MYFNKHGAGKFRENELLKQIVNGGYDGVAFAQLFKEGNGVFGKNKQYLADCLENLEHSKLIWREEISHKNVRYKAIFADDKVREDIEKFEAKLDAMFPEVRKGICSSKNKLNDEQTTKFFETIVYGELNKFLENMSVMIRVDQKWQDYVRYWTIKHNVDFFSVLLQDCFNTNGKALHCALSNIFQNLNKQKIRNMEGMKNEN